MAGTLFLIVGPSGVGKDTLLEGARAALAGNRWFRFARRVITRPADAGGEDHIAVSLPEFEALRARGGLLHHWAAHGLHYGIPADVAQDLAAGINVVLNTSRGAIAAFRAVAEKVVVIHVLASPAALAARLRQRNRETPEEIAARLARVAEGPTPGEGVLVVHNDGTVAEGVARLVDLIAGSCDLRAAAFGLDVELGHKPLCILHRHNPVAARLLAGSQRVELTAGAQRVVAELGWTDNPALAAPDGCALSARALEGLRIGPGDGVLIERLPSPRSRTVLRKKVSGGALSAPEMHRIVDDLVTGRFSDTEIAGFLVAAARNLSIDEVIALTKARASHVPHLDWEAATVVDKHSMGGIPGNRITPIVIPLVAAFGLTMPKTSSRAITSAAGTADVMEVFARVDLSLAEMRNVVRAAGACIAWNGRLTHSPVDDVMNAINRPLGLASTLLDVSSIISKKLAAGSTHVLIDLPVGPQAKTATRQEAEALKQLFETVGAGAGINTRVNLADGTRPIGRGIGPVLEAIDVFGVLSNAPDAPRDLEEKALAYAGLLIEWGGGAAAGSGPAVAQGLLRSGRALAKFEEIVRHQSPGHTAPLEAALVPGQFTWEMTAERAGRVAEMDIRAIASIARAAGAPVDKAAGVFLHAQVGQVLEPGAPILRVHSSSRLGLADARAQAAHASPIARLEG